MWAIILLLNKDGFIPTQNEWSHNYTVKTESVYSTLLYPNTHTVYGLMCVLGQFSVQYTLSFLQCIYAAIEVCMGVKNVGIISKEVTLSSSLRTLSEPLRMTRKLCRKYITHLRYVVEVWYFSCRFSSYGAPWSDNSKLSWFMRNLREEGLDSFSPVTLGN